MGDIVIFLKLLILLYADDTVLMIENHKDMQILLKIFDYCNEWKFKITLEKTKSMIIGRCRKKRNFMLNDSVIENNINIWMCIFTKMENLHTA